MRLAWHPISWLSVLVAGCGSTGSPCDLCDPNATCTVTGARVQCACPSGLEGNGLVCTTPGSGGSPCSPSPCGAGAACVVLEADDYRCECDRMMFTKTAGATSTVDCVSETVCLARNNNGALYNSLLESSHSAQMGGGCEGDEPEPTLTAWSLAPCTESSDESFGSFTSNRFAQCRPPSAILDVHGCLRLTDTGEVWDIEFSDWCVGEERPGGCFSYTRWRTVPDGVTCD